MPREIIDGALRNRRYFFKKADFFTGELGLSFSLILSGVIYGDVSNYDKGRFLLQDILGDIGKEIGAKEKDIWVLSVILKFLSEKDILEVDSNTIKQLMHTTMSKYRDSPRRIVRSNYFACFAYLGIDSLDPEAVWQEIVLQLSELKLDNKNIPFVYNCYVASTAFQLAGQKSYSYVLDLINKLVGNGVDGELDALHIDNLVMLYHITGLDSIIDILKRTLIQIINSNQSLSILVKTVCQLKVLYEDTELISGIRSIILKTSNWSLINGKLSLIYLDEDFSQESGLSEISFIFNLFD